MTTSTDISRRKLIGMGLAGAGAMMLPSPSLASGRGAHGLSMTNGNTGETFRLMLIENGRWVREALAEFDWFARDWREDAEYPIDPNSMMILIKLQKMMDTKQPLVLLSGYRTPKTNSSIRGAAKHSLHMRGLACDIHQPGRSTRDLHRAAVSLKAGGVGYYPTHKFVHVDSGNVRYWNG